MPDVRPPAFQPTVAQLFLTYLKIGLVGFGGVNAWARRVLVEEKRWLTEQEYAEVLGLGQVLPGPNALNVAIQLGDRFRGGPGALATTIGLFGGPLVVLMGLAILHDAYGEVPLVKAVLAGTAATAAGMILGTALKMATKLKPSLPIIAVGIAALIGGAALRLPLPYIVLGLAPFGIAAAWWTMKARA
ncbi:chromate transporter [Roseomonas stagni]|uniref:Chromate transporter n=1 Tax=Falsiroseomonas algicola TaxID=2716930 RepID=A0A6M1LK08_9PROT|nr:chromate transporter [Falsiroseomonas algicola]NGM20631.1 chromate transporter [Falsiroseomonas algicola]